VRVFAVLCLIVAATAALHAVDHVVTPKPETVEKNDVIDNDDEETVAAGSVATANGLLRIASKIYRPPPDCRFLRFPDTDPATHVDVYMAPVSGTPMRDPDTAARIRVTASIKAANADAFPLRTEGNIRHQQGRIVGGGVGQGGRPTATLERADTHWSAKVARSSCEDVKEYSRGNDDNEECQFETARVHVTFVATTGSSPSSLSVNYRAVIQGKPNIFDSRVPASTRFCWKRAREARAVRPWTCFELLRREIPATPSFSPSI